MWRYVAMSCLLGIVVFPEVASASGGAKIEITRAHVRLTVVTSHKIPASGDEARYAREMDAWEKTNRAAVEKVALAIERDVVGPYITRASLIAGKFDSNNLGWMTSEGIPHDGGAGNGWRLTIDLEPFPSGAAGASASFVLKDAPAKAVVRDLARDTQHAVLRALGKPIPPKPTYRAFWLLGDPAAPSLLLSTVPLADLPKALASSPWRPMSLEAFRHSVALVLATQGQKLVTRNAAGLLLANPTAARLEANGDLAVQINGTFHPAVKVQKATKGDAVRLLRRPLDPAPRSEADQAALAQSADEIDFLATLIPDVIE